MAIPVAMGALLLVMAACSPSGGINSSLPGTTAPGVPGVPSTTRVTPLGPASSGNGMFPTFLTVASTGSVTKGKQLIRYPVNQLQVRSVHSGAVEKTVLRSLGRISAVVNRDGSILAAIDYGCRSVLERVDPATGRARVARTVPGWVSDIALSPNGAELAYLTYPRSSTQPCTPSKQPASPQPFEVSAGPAGFLPNVLVVMNLATGAVRTAQTDAPGHPLSRLSWSPDGSELSVGYDAGDSNAEVIAVVPATDLAVTAWHQIVAPAGCGWASPAWAAGGIIAAEGCGPNGPSLSPTQLVELSSAGNVMAHWPLPACIDGITAIADPTFKQVLVQEDIGYGTGPPCGIPTPGTKGAGSITPVPFDTSRFPTSRQAAEVLDHLGFRCPDGLPTRPLELGRGSA
ncbi:MAG: hypothetical protein M3137_12670 [Actinomycetota bacterium]|nr:hypothetical protein [Actinomycetota bacterium]